MREVVFAAKARTTPSKRCARSRRRRRRARETLDPQIFFFFSNRRLTRIESTALSRRSGKTTLLNHILQGDHGKRIVVIENELGSVSIDHSLLDEARQKDAPHGVLVLKNGCMCCSGDAPGSELERVLDKLLEMGRFQGGSLPFDCVLIETTGMADPGPVAQTFFVDDTVAPR